MTLAIVQARMGSGRLPGKALAPLSGQPMIWRQLERLRNARTLTRIVVATSCEAADDVLAAWLVSQGQAVFRGAPSDLLDRFSRCATSAGPADHVVRVKGDAPFVDPRVIDEAVSIARVSGADYVSNRDPASYPRGLEVEVITTSALAAAAAEPREIRARVSPTAFIRAHPERFSQASFSHPRDLSRLDWRVKTAADLGFARSIYNALHPVDPAFVMDDVLDLIGGRQDLARFSCAA
ncbi:MAG: glycosyltransferase family protein [Caulobacter sp.]|nr:glycosyltransferase family protein [Caulobacter sp.]